ncbi:MAG: fimbria/pilus outer membrane usher protein [Achromobacter sp.]|uniref:fimbria/pilus outer membrane usher protein n=1 Tax=Achromobacter sp. TaxID=134375 RepID=UPI003D0017EC
MRLTASLSVAGTFAYTPASEANDTLDPQVPAASLAGEENLYLEVTLNYVALRRIEHFVSRGGRLYADAATLRNLGLTWPGADRAAGWIALDSLAGLRVRLDAADQSVALFAPVAMLSGPIAEIGYQTPAAPRLDPETRAPGLLLNYDLYAQKDRYTRSLSGWSELRMFGVGPGVWRSSNLTQSVRSNYGDAEFRNTRLDSSWQLDFPSPMVSLTLGDAYSGALSWTRSLRFGGVRLSRNFDLQPYRVTVPLATFRGEAALPSIVDLYINGVREAQSQVRPGQFQIVSAPVITGAGSAQMVITDITGQRRVVNFSIYNSAQLLQQGLGDWSFEAGKAREDYGLRSFAYANSMMYSGSARYGLTDHVTLEAHGETSDGLTMGGLGALARVGQFGVVSGSYASSREASRRGRQYRIGYEWQGERLSVNLSTLRRDSAFRDVGTLQGSQLPLRSAQAFVGWAVGHGQLGASYVQQDYRDSPRARYVGLSWAQSLGRYGNLTLSGNRDLDGAGGNSAFVYWSIPLGGRIQTWTSFEHQREGNTASVGVARNLAGDTDGWGWRVQASAGDRRGGQAEVNELTRYGEWRAGSQYWGNPNYGGGTTVYGGATGGLLLMQGSLFPMRRVYDAFALVSTDGIADVPVKLENRVVGKTDERGLLLVTPLNAWQNNDLSIDPLGLPANVNVTRTRLMAVPATASGTLARFPMKVTLTVEFGLRAADGDWIAAGTAAVLEPGGRQVIIGYDGRVYLEDPPAGARLVVTLPSGACQAELPAALPREGWTELGELTCRQTTPG